jgi:hypothetical protein
MSESPNALWGNQGAASRPSRPPTVQQPPAGRGYLHAADGSSFCTDGDGITVYVGRCASNGRILLVILFPRDTATVTALDFRDFWAFNDSNARHYFRHVEDDQQYPGGYCWSSPKYRNGCAQHAFFEGKKAEQTSSRKSTSRTLKGGWPTVSGRFLLVLRECSDAGGRQLHTLFGTRPV